MSKSDSKTLAFFYEGSPEKVRDRVMLIANTTKLLQLVIAENSGIDWSDVPLELVLPAAIEATKKNTD